jgi:hypothetical protein
MTNWTTDESGNKTTFTHQGWEVRRKGSLIYVESPHPGRPGRRGDEVGWKKSHPFLS